MNTFPLNRPGKRTQLGGSRGMGPMIKSVNTEDDGGHVGGSSAGGLLKLEAKIEESLSTLELPLASIRNSVGKIRDQLRPLGPVIASIQQDVVNLEKRCCLQDNGATRIDDLEKIVGSIPEVKEQ